MMFISIVKDKDKNGKYRDNVDKKDNVKLRTENRDRNEDRDAITNKKW